MSKSQPRILGPPDPGRTLPKTSMGVGRCQSGPSPRDPPGEKGLLDAFKNIYFLFRPGTPGTLKIGRERRPRTPQISSSSPGKSLIFEAGVGDRLATIRVSKAKR